MSLVKYLWFQRKDLTGNVNSSQTTVLCTIDLPIDKHLSRCIYYHLIFKKSSWDYCQCWLTYYVIMCFITKERVKKHPSKLCFIFEDQTWTYQQVEEHANRVANYFHDAGFRKGDVVSVFMENSPQTIFFWMGLSKIGVVSALINFNLRLETLAHSINAAESKALIFGGEMSEGKVASIWGIVASNTESWVMTEYWKQ